MSFYHTKRDCLAYLVVNTWVGTSVYGATHYYGRLEFKPEHGKRDEPLERKVNAEEAARLTKEDRGMTGGHRYKAGDFSTRFWDEASLRELAKATWRQKFPEARLLVEGDFITLDPQLALDGPPELVAKLNEIYAQCEANNFWEGDEKNMGKLSDAWNRLVEEGLSAGPS